MKDIACSILAGGRGSRLFPLTFKKAKPAVLFGTGYRLIDIPISNALNAHISSISIFTQYYPELLEKHIEEAFYERRIHPSKISVFGPPIGPFGESQLFQGTADAMRKTRAYFESLKEDYILILSGDQLYSMDFAHFLDKAKKSEAELMIACLEVNEADAKRMGIMRVDNEDRIVDFLEKPQKSQDLERLRTGDGTFLASMGIYIFKKQTLLKLLDLQGDDFGKDLIPRQLEKGGVFAYKFEGYWEDIGTVEAFYKANMALIHQKSCLDITSENRPILSKQHHLSCPLIRSCSIDDSLLSLGTTIKASKISRSIIGLGASLQEECEIYDSVLLGTSHEGIKTEVGPGSVLKNVILDEGVKIGARVKLVNKDACNHYDGDGIFIRDGITIVQAGTTIPDGFEL